MTMKLAIDFDGTCVRKATYPAFGEDVPNAVESLKSLKRMGCQLFLWTCRNGEALQAAIRWFESHGIELAGVNENENCTMVDPSVKIDVDYYIDDKALGCPLDIHGSVHWENVYSMLAIKLEKMQLARLRKAINEAL